MPLHPPCPACSSTGVRAYGTDAVALCTGDPTTGGAPCPYALEVERGLASADAAGEAGEESLPQ